MVSWGHHKGMERVVLFLCRQCPWRHERVAMEIKLVQSGGGEGGINILFI